MKNSADYKAVPGEEGISRSIKTGRWRFKVSARVNGQRVFGEGTRPAEATIEQVRAAKKQREAELAQQVAEGGGPAVNGLFSGMVRTFWQRVKTSPTRRAALENKYIPFWLAKFGNRSRDWMIKNVPELIAALDTIVSERDDKPIAAGTKDHYVAALSKVFTTVDGKHAPNPAKEIEQFAVTDPSKLPRRDQDYFLIDQIFAEMNDVWKGETCIAKVWLRCLAYAGLGPALLSGMGRDSFLPKQRIVIPVHRHKAKGAQAVPRKLTDEGYEALLDFDRLDLWGKTAPDYSTMQRAFQTGLEKALARLQAHPEQIPDGVRLDFKRAARMTPRDLRHSYGSWVVRETKNIDVARRYLGHAFGSRVVYRYTQGGIDDLMEAAGAQLATSFRARPKLALVKPTRRRRIA